MPLELDDIDWDTDKEEANVRKHGISFDQTRAVFNDEMELVLYDEEHSQEEVRYISIGRSDQQIMVVIYAPRGRKLRIISARRATEREASQYMQQSG